MGTTLVTMRALKAIVLLSAVCIPFHSAIAHTPIDTAQSFYKWLIEHDGGGIPSEKRMKHGETLLSGELKRLLRAAAATERRCIATTPNDLKPLIFEGSGFVENYEGLSHIDSLRFVRQNGRNLIFSRLSYLSAGAPKSETHHWNDQLELVWENGKWVVSNSGKGDRSVIKQLRHYVDSDCDGRKR